MGKAISFLNDSEIKLADMLLNVIQCDYSLYGDEKTLEEVLEFEDAIINMYLENEKIYNFMIKLGCSKSNSRESLLDLPNLDINHIKYYTELSDIQKSVFDPSLLYYFIRSLQNTPISERCIERKLMHELINNDEFDIKKINELTKLFDTLVHYGVLGAHIVEPEDFDELKFLHKGGYAATEVPHDFLSMDFDDEDEVMIHKIYSDADIDYFKRDESELFNNNILYDAKFEQVPKWVFSGAVRINKDKEVSLSISSPHTKCHYIGTTLYPNVADFPSREEFYSVKQSPSLTKHLMKKH